MNNLYGYAMIQKLPVGSFRFHSENEIQTFDLHSVSKDDDTGYILEASLKYPEKLHDMHNDYPLAPEKKHVSDENLSPYAKYLWEKLHGKAKDGNLHQRGKVEKLLTTLEDKEHYISR